MGFWGEKIRELNPEPVQQAPPQQAPAPGQWWQQGMPTQPAPQPQQAVATQQIRVDGYAPVTADITTAEIDRCPRCDSDNYAAMHQQQNRGGQPVVGAIKQCFDCRYPAPNATGELIGKGAVVEKTETVNNHTVRYASGARQQSNSPVSSWSNVATGEALGNTPKLFK